MTNKKASLGVALIARDAEGTIRQCLDSFRKHVQQVVVCVDELTTDKTARIARSLGANVYPVKVSDWHECEGHGRILVQHFANARNESFGHLDPSLDWWMWIDSDDVLDGAENLPAICDELRRQNAVGAWQPYDYGNVEGRVSTVFHRERILRSSVGWRWRYRVHEVVEPVGDQLAGWQIRDDLRFVHQEHPRSEPAAARNLRLLEIDLEDDPNNSRTLFYMGNQYFAMQDWEAAAYWYERLLAVGQNVYEKWQCATYMSMAYQRAGDLYMGEIAAFRAIGIMPQHPEPYYQLAAIAKYRGDAERCLYWTKVARDGKEPPPFFVFKNPLDYSFNHRVVASDALAQLGHIPEARFELEEAAKALPDPTVVAGAERYRNLEQWAEYANAYVTLARSMPDEAKIALWEALDFSPEIKQFGRARDVVVPAYIRSRPNTQPRIAFWCGRSYEEWSPESLNTTGIGGSETAVVEIARRFADHGWRVDVFNGAGRHEGIYDAVGYWEPERYITGAHNDVVVSWRQPAFRPESDHRILWCHDLNYGPQATEHMANFSKVLGVSAWHAKMLKRYYGIEADFVPNGVDIDRFNPTAKRVPMQCVYTSSPDRGLEGLLYTWSRVVEREPGATLVIAYGWDNVDKLIGAGRDDLAAYKAHIETLIARTPNVEWRGRLPQDQLAALFDESYLWLYPTQFLEVSCITAMESLAGGCVPVTSSVGALRETIADYGITIPGAPWSRAFGDFFVLSTLAALTQPDVRVPLSLNGPARAAELSWDRAFEKWQAVTESLLTERELVAA